MDKCITSQKSRHNGIISFWKFMFSLMIIALHVKLRMNAVFGINLPDKNHFGAGSIAVEFFFIVSGYLMTKKALSVKKMKINA